MPWPRGPCHVSGLGEAGLTSHVINALTPCIVWQAICTLYWLLLLGVLLLALFVTPFTCYHPWLSILRGTPCPPRDAGMALGPRFSARCRHRPHPDSAMPTRSGHSCWLPRPPFDSTHNARVVLVSTDCACPFAASPSVASPGRRGSAAYARSYPLAC